MFKKILMALVVIAAVFAGIVALQPDEFHVERSMTVAAAPAVVFEKINDLQKWQAWSPWAKLDPNAKVSFAGPTSGVGAVFRWAGNKEVGEGSMTITESVPNERVQYRLDFIKPFQGTSTAAFVLKPQADQTLVTWSTDGKKNFIFKAIGLFMDCDKKMGEQLEKGLANLKSLSETAAPR